MQRLALTITYDGSRFAGSQIQPGQRTVQAVMEDALGGFYGRPTAAVFAGRTDRGVHAAGQVVSCFDGRPDLELKAVQAALNARLPDDVAVIRTTRRDGRFHARYDARWREYRYRVWAGERAPLARHHVWQRRAALDPRRMNDAASRVPGRRDFASIAGGGEGVPWSSRRRQPRGTVRTVVACALTEGAAWWCAGQPGDGRLWELRVVADGFLPHMVRNLVSVLVDVGRCRRQPDWVDELLSATDRRLAPAMAPPQGLVFWGVGYEEDQPTGWSVGEPHEANTISKSPHFAA